MLTPDEDKIVKFPQPEAEITADEVTVEEIFERGKAWNCSDILMLGMDENGDVKFGTSISDVGTLLIILEAAKAHILRSAMGIE